MRCLINSLKAFFLMIILGYALCPYLFSQNPNVIGGISIADDTIPPHPSAILDIRSASKGVIVPEMSSIQRDNIQNPADGLLVFVTDTTELRGLWFYNKNAQQPNQGEWQQLKFRKTYYPMGAIIMYDGLVDGYFDDQGKGISVMEGWHICNGKDGTPDLTDMFIVGVNPSEDDYKVYGPYHPSTNNKIKGPANTYILQGDTLPVHNHEIKDTTVSQLATPHTHELKTKDLTDVYNNIHEFKYLDAAGRPGFSFRRLHKYKGSKEYSFESSGLGLQTQENIEKVDGQISLVFGNTGEATPAPFDNRPPYYTLVYIMRTSTPYQPFVNITNPKVN